MNTATDPAHVPSRLWERITSQKPKRVGEVFFKEKKTERNFICKFYEGHDADAARVIECLKACAWFEHPEKSVDELINALDDMMTMFDKRGVGLKVSDPEKEVLERASALLLSFKVQR